MASNMPTTIPDLITWCNTHGPLWQTNATSIGLSAAQATAFNGLISTFTTASGKANDARQAAKDATKQLQTSIDAVRALGNAYILMIKAYAQTSNNPNVYALAGVSPEDPPSTLPAPVAPDKISATVNPDGSLTIKWKVGQPVGVTNVQYVVSRRINGGDGPFTLFTTVGAAKTFTDDALPVGVDKVEYLIQPKRGEVFGPMSNVFAVQFGSVPDGLTVTGPNVKLAA